MAVRGVWSSINGYIAGLDQAAPFPLDGKSDRDQASVTSLIANHDRLYRRIGNIERERARTGRA